MIVPTIERAGVPSSVNQRPVDATPSNLDFRDGTQALSQGIGQAAAGVADVATVAHHLAEKARERAKAISKSNADADYQGILTKLGHGDSQAYQPLSGPLTEAQISNVGGPPEGTPGFFATRGQEAHAASADVLDQALQARETIAKARFADKADQTEWLAESRGTLESFHKQVESHVSAQFAVAGKDALEGLQSTSLEAANNNPFDGSAAEKSAANVEAKIRALQTTKEGGDADVAAYRSKLTQVRINALIDANDFESAKKLFDAQSGDLGPNVDRGNLVKAINQGMDEGEVRRMTESIFRSTVRADLTPWGDEAKAREQVAKVPPKLQDRVSKMLELKFKQAEDNKKEFVHQKYNNALEVLVQTGGNLNAVDPRDRVQLQDRKNDPDAWVKLVDIAHKYETMARVRKGSQADERRDQAARNKEALNDFLALPTAERASTDIPKFLAGRGVDAVGTSALGPAQRSATDNVKRGQSERVDSFVADAMAAAQGTFNASGKEALKRSQDAFKASATQAYNDFVEKHKGEHPSKTEALQLISEELISNAPTKPRSFGPFTLSPGEEPGWKKLQRERKTDGKAPAAAPSTTAQKLPPGRYQDKSGKVWTVDADGNKRGE